jgi:predicted transcriptional regulator
MTDDLPVTDRDREREREGEREDHSITSNLSITSAIDDSFLYPAVLQETTASAAAVTSSEKGQKKNVILDKPREIEFDPETGKFMC